MADDLMWRSATELAGMVVGLRRRHPYDVFWIHGDPATITRDAVFRGTALSARCRTCSFRPP